MKKLLLTTAAMLAFVGSAFAHDYKLGDLTIEHPVARETPANAPVSGGYMTIINNGDKADRLIEASVKFAGRTEIHEMKMDGDVMQMRELDAGLEIPAGETVKLMPGGFHLMFMGLEETLEEGATYNAKLVFENAGDIEVILLVEPLDKIREALGGAKMDHSGHGHNHGHGHGHSNKSE